MGAENQMQISMLTKRVLDRLNHSSTLISLSSMHPTAKQEPSTVFLIPQGITQGQAIPTSDASLVAQAVEGKPRTEWVVMIPLF